MNFKLYVKETLQRKIDIEADDIEEAIQMVKTKYDDCEIVLDAADHVETTISDSEFDETEKKILDEITTFCGEHCPSVRDCPEEECVLFRIEKLIERG